jgi:hypothetical protein
MSPTSYQAAPPRENIIANARARVKRFEASPQNVTRYQEL